MSFITNQLLAQATAEMNSIKGTIATGGGSADLENKLRGLTKHIGYLSKQLATEEAKMQQDKDAVAAVENAKKAKRDGRGKKAEVEPEDKPKKLRFEDATLQCCDCEADFVFSGADQAFFARNNFTAPVRCAECRAAKKASRPQPQEIECCDCKETFVFSVGQQISFKENGWDAPVRCMDCRKAKKATAPKPVLINCKDCSKDFSFSAGAQKHYKEQGWTDPVRCSLCRNEKKSKASGSVKGGSVKSAGGGAA